MADDTDIELVWWGQDQTLAHPNGKAEPYQPFTANRSWYNKKSAQMTTRRWPRLLPVEQYNEMLNGFDREQLKNHLKIRRKITGEDLNAGAGADDMREAMCLDVPAEAAAE